MIVYNVTFLINHSIEKEWNNWIINEYIPDVLKTNCFHDYSLLKLLDNDEAEGITYALQFFAESKAMYNRYSEKYADKMHQKNIKKWKDDCLSFSTLLQKISSLND